MQPNVNIISNWKGGVGKSVCAALLTDYLRTHETPMLAFDVDPTNSTLNGFDALQVQYLPLIEGERVNPLRFDPLLATLLTSDFRELVLDTGSTGYIDTVHYLVSNRVLNRLQSRGRTLTIHTVIAGGRMLKETLQGFDDLVQKFPAPATFIVWLNPYFGPIKSDKSADFFQMAAYQRHKQRIKHVVEIPTLTSTFAHSLDAMLNRSQRFAQAYADPGVELAAKLRLEDIEADLAAQLDPIYHPVHELAEVAQ